MRAFSILTTLTIAAALINPALAQSATVTVSHNDPDGIVFPGQVLTVRLDAAWTGPAPQAGLTGDLLPSTPVGVSSNLFTVLPPGPSVTLGTLGQGGVVGFDARFPANPGGAILAFDYTVPANHLGPITFSFNPLATSPNLRLYPAVGGPNFVLVQTSFAPASVTVIPAPAALCTLILAPLAATRRRLIPRI